MTTETIATDEAPSTDPLLELSLAVAARAGWENIQEWNPSHKPKKVFQGTNKKHPELGIFVPDYVRDLNAIVKAFDFLGISWNVDVYGSASTFDPYVETFGETPAIALCKLLLELAPNFSDVAVDELCQKGYEQAVAETQPEINNGDFVTIAGLEIEA